MSDALIVAALAGVALIAAILSFVAWHLLARRPPSDSTRTGFDSGDPDV